MKHLFIMINYVLTIKHNIIYYIVVYIYSCTATGLWSSRAGARDFSIPTSGSAIACGVASREYCLLVLLLSLWCSGYVCAMHSHDCYNIINYR